MDHYRPLHLSSGDLVPGFVIAKAPSRLVIAGDLLWDLDINQLSPARLPRGVQEPDLQLVFERDNFKSFAGRDFSVALGKKSAVLVVNAVRVLPLSLRPVEQAPADASRPIPSYRRGDGPAGEHSVARSGSAGRAERCRRDPKRPRRRSRACAARTPKC